MNVDFTLRAYLMMYSLVDTENRASSMKQRKGIIEDLEKAISANFYQNEKDATDYYARKMDRKKDYGGKYNERFYNVVNEEAAEYNAEETDKDEVDA